MAVSYVFICQHKVNGIRGLPTTGGRGSPSPFPPFVPSSSLGPSLPWGVGQPTLPIVHVTSLLQAVTDDLIQKALDLCLFFNLTIPQKQ